MKILAVAFILGCFVIGGSLFAASLEGGLNPGTGATLRTSSHYVLADTIGQFTVGRSDSANMTVEHGFWHSTPPSPSIGELKELPDDTNIETLGRIVTAGTNQFDGTFYLEDPDRSGGIRVYVGSNSQIAMAVGDMVDVTGIIKTFRRERYIESPQAIVSFPGVWSIEPLTVNNQWLGGRGTDVIVPGGTGVNNLSLLVKTFGRIIYVDTAAPPRFFYIDDGSNLFDGLLVSGEPIHGIRILLTGLVTGNAIAAPETGEYVGVTGICSPVIDVGGKVFAAVRPRNQEDIQLIGD